MAAPAAVRHPATLAALPYYAYHPFGVERRRAELIRRVTARAAWFEAIVDLPLAEAYARLTAVPGIGPWTAAEVGVRALGDEDAVSVGDFHLPNLVAYALAREPRGTDDRMLELLEPYRGVRARVVRLLELSGRSRTALRPAPVRAADRGPLAAQPARNRSTASTKAATVAGVHGSSDAMTCSAPAASCARNPAAMSSTVPDRPGDVGAGASAAMAAG